MLAGLPVGQLSFLLMADADCLPTPMNLCCWNYRVSNSCPLCQFPNVTTAHTLNGCPKALNQGHFSLRHDSVLNGLVSQILSKIDGSTKMFADLPGKQASDSPPATILADISTTTSRPDLVLITGPEVTFLELTVPFNSPEALAAAKSRKSLKSNYLQLAIDLDDSGWSLSYFTLEIGSLDHSEPNTTRTLSDAFLLSKQEAKQVLLLRIAVPALIIFSMPDFAVYLGCEQTCILLIHCFLFYFYFTLFHCVVLFIYYLHIFCQLPCQAHHSSVLVSCPRLLTCTSSCIY